MCSTKAHIIPNSLKTEQFMNCQQTTTKKNTMMTACSSSNDLDFAGLSKTIARLWRVSREVVKVECGEVVRISPCL